MATPSAKFQPPPLKTSLLAEDGTVHQAWAQWISLIAPRLTSPVVIGTPHANGVPGQIAQDGTYLYICTATNIWKKIPLSAL